MKSYFTANLHKYTVRNNKSILYNFGAFVAIADAAPGLSLYIVTDFPFNLFAHNSHAMTGPRSSRHVMSVVHSPLLFFPLIIRVVSKFVFFQLI